MDDAGQGGHFGRLPGPVLADTNLSLRAKVVYAAISTYGGYDEVRPGIDSLAGRSGLCRRSVQKAVRELVGVGYLVLVEGGGRRRCNIYQLGETRKPCTPGTVSDVQKRRMRRKFGEAKRSVSPKQRPLGKETVPFGSENSATCAPEDLSVKTLGIEELNNPSFAEKSPANGRKGNQASGTSPLATTPSPIAVLVAQELAAYSLEGGAPVGEPQVNQWAGQIHAAILRHGYTREQFSEARRRLVNGGCRPVLLAPSELLAVMAVRPQ